MTRRRLWSVPVGIATAVFGVWVADVFVPVFRIDGSLPVRLLTGAAVAGIAFAVGAALVLAFGAAFSAFLLRDTFRQVRAADPFEDDGTPVTVEPVPAPRPSPVTAFVIALGMSVAIPAVAIPVAFAVATWTCRLVGAPVEMSGGWAAYLAAGLVATAVADVVRSVLRPPAERTKARAWGVGRLTYVGLVAVLCLAVEFVAGVRLAPPEYRSVLVHVFVLAAMFGSLRGILPGRVGLVSQAPFNLLVLWVLAWLTGWLDGRLEFAGWWPLTLTALAITAVTLPSQLLAPPSDPSSAVRPMETGAR
nr:hypothetical protein [Micromonospora sp. DSM 115978]